jgi:hypothetical protein
MNDSEADELAMRDKLIDKFPQFNPEWHMELQAQWWEGFGKLIEMLSYNTKNKSGLQRITSKEIREVIKGKTGEFRSMDIFSDVKIKFPTKEVPRNYIYTTLFLSKREGLIREVRREPGENGAVYVKVIVDKSV